VAQGRRDAGRCEARGSGISLALALFAAAPLRPCAAQAPSYVPAQLACVQFEVRVATSVTTDLQGRRQVEELRREGRLSVRGTAADGGIAIEAWWDSLVLWRRAEGRMVRPDADGILGGRYRGVLSASGHFTRSSAPWIPDEMAEVSDLSVALDDFFPDFSAGTVRRLGRTRAGERFRLFYSKEVEGPVTSERPFAVHESESSDGIAVWDREGLVSWDRKVTAETRVAETPRRNFRSTVVQGIELRRVGKCTA
jgi:hypothetical protein